MLHCFCKMFGYANIAKKNPKTERLYRNSFVAIKVVFVILAIICYKMSFDVLHIEKSNNAVISATGGLLVTIDIVTLYVHIFQNGLKAPKIHQFWQKLQKLEEEFNKIGIKIDHKCLKIIAIIGTAPECLVLFFGLLGYAKLFVGATLEEFVLHVSTGISFLVAR